MSKASTTEASIQKTTAKKAPQTTEEWEDVSNIQPALDLAKNFYNLSANFLFAVLLIMGAVLILALGMNNSTQKLIDAPVAAIQETTTVRFNDNLVPNNQSSSDSPETSTGKASGSANLPQKKVSKITQRPTRPTQTSDSVSTSSQFSQSNNPSSQDSPPTSDNYVPPPLPPAHPNPATPPGLVISPGVGVETLLHNTLAQTTTLINAITVLQL